MVTFQFAHVYQRVYTLSRCLCAISRIPCGTAICFFLLFFHFGRGPAGVKITELGTVLFSGWHEAWFRLHFGLGSFWGYWKHCQLARKIDMHTDIIHNPEIAMLFMDRHVQFPEIIYCIYIPYGSKFKKYFGVCSDSGHGSIGIYINRLIWLIFQGLVNVPFWEYWTSPYSSHLVDH